MSSKTKEIGMRRNICKKLNLFIIIYSEEISYRCSRVLLNKYHSIREASLTVSMLIHMAKLIRVPNVYIDHE